MHPIRHIFEEAPDVIPVPEELRRRRVEFILWPLEETQPGKKKKPCFKIADVDVIDILSREERNVRR